MKELEVIYDGPLDSEMDRKITEFLKSLGWKWNGSGFDLISGKRDMTFEKSPHLGNYEG